MSEQVEIHLPLTDKLVVAEYLNRPEGDSARLWIIEVYQGFESAFFLVDAYDEGTALDELADSEFGHLIIDEEFRNDPVSQPDQTYAGNESLPIRGDLISIRAYRGHVPQADKDEGYGITS